MRKTVKEKETELAEMDDTDGLTEREREIIRQRFSKEHMQQNRIIFFYTSHVRGKYMYFCTACQKWHVTDHKIRQGEMMRCESCGQRLEVMRYKKLDDNLFSDYYTKIDRLKDGDVVLRVFYVTKEIRKEDCYAPTWSFLEVERVNMNNGAAVKRNSILGIYGDIYHNSYGADSDRYDRWTSDRRTKYYRIYPYDSIVAYSKRSIRKVLRGSSFEYSGLIEYMDMKKYPVDIWLYLKAYKEIPEIEKFTKCGCLYLVTDIISRCRYDDKSIRSLADHLTPHKTRLIIKNSFNLKQAFITAEIGDEIVNPDVELIATMSCINYGGSYEEAVREKPLISYLFRQRVTQSDYEDYLRMAQHLRLDMSRKEVRRPKHLAEKHNELMREIAKEREECCNSRIAEKNRSIDEGIRKQHDQLDGLSEENDALLIRPAESRKELFEESERMHHCVKTYAERVARGETSIFFIRRKDKPDESLATLELNQNRIIQCRAVFNGVPDDSVKDFVNQWASEHNFKSCF